ncbi:MAG: ATP-dependent endonuclease [Promethearchaeota archaeon]
MKIKEIGIKNFRGIEDLTLKLNDFTILIGKNGVGKSSVLHALNFFKEQKYPLKIEDYYMKDLTRQIEVSLTFIELTSEEKEEFQTYIQENELKVIKIANGDVNTGNPNISQKLHGQKLMHKYFKSIREESVPTPKRALYDQLRKEEKYSSLQSVRKADDIESNLIRWEEDHPNELELIIDSGQFFGWPGVGVGKLNKYMEFFFVPAVHEYSTEETEKSSYLKEILNLTIRKRLSTIPEVEDLKKNTIIEYQRIIGDQNKTIVEKLSNDLSKMLEILAPGCSISVDCRPGEVNFLDTTYGTELEEYGFKGPISSVGHGVQRTSFFILLRYLGEQQVISKIDNSNNEEHQEEPKENKFFILFIIEEPELYLHPNRIRLIKKILQDLTLDSDDSMFRFQIICSSHSPYLIDLQDAEDIRIMRKIKNNGDYRVLINEVQLDKVAGELKTLHQFPSDTVSDATTLKGRLKAIMTLELSEGFFADKIVLVEGMEDKAVIQAIDQYKEKIFDSEGIVVIPVIGKNNLDRPALIFQDLGIPVYLIFDTDSDCNHSERDSNERINTVLKTIMNEVDLSNPFEMKIETNYTSLDPKMTKVIKNAVGDVLYTQIMDELKDKYEFKKDKDCRKNYMVMTEFIQRVYDSGKSIPELEEIIQKMYDL